ncbi:MAG: Fe-S cluster assembly protein SufD [Alistipes sp.]|nr:Fe-S cluster assembly protein SufD [Alistipes sp.]
MENIEKRWVELYRANAELIEEGTSEAINRPRGEALEQFMLQGVPAKGSGHGDRYHYTDLRKRFESAYESYFTPAYQKIAPPEPLTTGLHLACRNGFCTAEGGLRRTAEGVIYGSLRTASVECAELVDKHYNQLVSAQATGVTALNTLMVQDGTFLYVPRHVSLQIPILLDLWLYSEAESVASFLRHLWIFEEGCSVRLVVDHRSLSPEAALASRVRELFVGTNSRVEIVDLFRCNARTTLVSESFARQDRSSRLQTLALGLGGEIVHYEQTVQLTGAGAENHTDGLMLCGTHEQIDFTTDLRHEAPDCTSHELFKGVAAEEGCGVFSGRIYVAPGAQRTQAFQQSNNLLLNDRAHFYAKPHLEIYADDVKCSHGATVGQLDDQAIFYMRQRGIDEAQARRLQMSGFINQVIQKDSCAGICELLEELAVEKIQRM